MAEKKASFILFIPEKLKTLLIDWFKDELKQIRDPITGALKLKEVMTCHVIEEDLVTCDKTWGVTSEKAKADLRGMDRANGLINVRIDVTAHGYGFERTYSIGKHKEGIVSGV